MRICRSPDPVHVESDLEQRGVVQYVPAVENKSRMLHGIKDPLVVELLETGPRSQDQERLRAFDGFVRIVAEADPIAGERQFLLRIGQRFRIVNGQECAFFEQQFDDGLCRCLAGVARVFLEGIAEDRDLLLRDRIEHGGQNVVNEMLGLRLIDFQNALPVGGGLRQTVIFAEINQIQQILLEAGTSETDPGPEKFRPDSGVASGGRGNLGDAGAPSFRKARTDC